MTDGLVIFFVKNKATHLLVVLGKIPPSLNHNSCIFLVRLTFVLRSFYSDFDGKLVPRCHDLIILIAIVLLS